MIYSGYSRSYFNLFFLIYAITCDTHKLHEHITYFHKYKNSVDKLETKILIQFSKVQDKKPFVGPFLSPTIWNLTSLIF